MIQWRNSADRYGAIAKAFHWLVAALILINLVIGLNLDDMPMGAAKFRMFYWHKSIGSSVLILVAARLLWTLYNGWPRSLPTHARWERVLAKTVHGLLYWCMVTVPLSGWLMSSAKGMSVSVFGWFTLPNLIGQNKVIGHYANRYHVIMAWVLMVLIGLHVLGALKHWLWDRDDTLRRMLPFAKLRTPLAALFLCVWIGTAHAAPSLPLWTIDAKASHVTFIGTQEMTPFTGIIPHFTGAIAFDPARLAEGKVTIHLPLQNIKTGSDDRDQYIDQKPWLDAVEFPEAVYTTIGFDKTATGYIAHGVLTLRGVKMPVDLPFTLVITPGPGGKQTAIMHGTATLDRLKFGIGTGEWADPKTVGAMVKVQVDLVAATP